MGGLSASPRPAPLLLGLGIIVVLPSCCRLAVEALCGRRDVDALPGLFAAGDADGGLQTAGAGEEEEEEEIGGDCHSFLRLPRASLALDGRLDERGTESSADWRLSPWGGPFISLPPTMLLFPLLRFSVGGR
jgi:hypothetical protein